MFQSSLISLLILWRFKKADRRKRISSQTCVGKAGWELPYHWIDLVGGLLVVLGSRVGCTCCGRTSVSSVLNVSRYENFDMVLSGDNAMVSKEGFCSIIPSAMHYVKRKKIVVHTWIRRNKSSFLLEDVGSSKVSIFRLFWRWSWFSSTASGSFNAQMCLWDLSGTLGRSTRWRRRWLQ